MEVQTERRHVNPSTIIIRIKTTVNIINPYQHRKNKENQEDGLKKNLMGQEGEKKMMMMIKQMKHLKNIKHN